MSQTARTARLLEAATADLKASAMPAYAVGYEREWLLGTLIGKIESAAMFRDLGNIAKADELFDEALAAIAAHRDHTLTPSFARQHSKEAF